MLFADPGSGRLISQSAWSDRQAPSIDPFSPKNQELDDETVVAILARIGVLDGAAPDGQATFVRSDGETGVVTRSAQITGEGAPRPPQNRW